MVPRSNAVPEPHRTPRSKPSRKQAHSDQTIRTFMRLWRDGTKVNEIAKQCNISQSTAYQWQKNCLESGSVNKPPKDTLTGRPNSMTIEDEKALRDHLIKHGWFEQKDMVVWLKENRGVIVSQSTVSRLLRRNSWRPATFGHRDGRVESETSGTNGSNTSMSQVSNIDPQLQARITRP